MTAKTRPRAALVLASEIFRGPQRKERRGETAAAGRKGRERLGFGGVLGHLVEGTEQLARGTSGGGCLGGESDRGEGHAGAVTVLAVRRWKRGAGWLGRARHWGL